MCLNFGTPKIIYFSIGTNGKFIILSDCLILEINGQMKRKADDDDDDDDDETVAKKQKTEDDDDDEDQEEEEIPGIDSLKNWNTWAQTIPLVNEMSHCEHTQKQGHFFAENVRVQKLIFCDKILAFDFLLEYLVNHQLMIWF